MIKPSDLMYEVIAANQNLFQNPDTHDRNIAIGWALVLERAKQKDIELASSQRDLFEAYADGAMATAQLIQDDQALRQANEISALFLGRLPCFVGP